MKTFFLAVILLGMAIYSYGQSKSMLTTTQELSELSDLQFKAGLILVGGGTTLVVTSLVIPRKFDYSDGSGNQRLRSFLTVTGLLSIMTSVPLFLSSGSNARMAAQLSLQNQAVYQPIFLPGQPRDIPALTLSIQL
ncbi:hypothetical protein MMU07_20720 [Aquiflexum sp. LQ15W]|uniref:hypothetical protein n=1 Tax=Cognataquiflexum nitidum TaxID=2922272 RepID=UPI001F146264|nr:hypothetical protein [Cognataquiflexum nitidum]MCH6202012.1 hypothetical protein [Cognataquiflexum nitidum]